MFTTTSNKRKLLQGASALVLGSVSVTVAAAPALAQTVVTTTTTVTPPLVDALVRSDQSKSEESTATVNDFNNKIGGGSVDVTESALEITSSSTTAIATQNSALLTVTDPGEAFTPSKAGNVVEQDNTGNTLARIGSAAGTEVQVTADETTGSDLTISGTLNRATATGNTASTTVNETDFASITGSAFSATRQQNTGATGEGNKSVTATVNATDIKITSGATARSPLTVSGSTDSAVATANSLTQRMTLDGTSLTLGTVSAALDTAPTQGPDVDDDPDTPDTVGVADVNAVGKALLSSRQTNTFTDVSATNTASSIKIIAGAANGSSLELTTNAQNAIATGSAAANVLAVSGTTVGTGVGIVSSQASDAQSTVTAATTGQVGITASSLGNSTASSASLTDNKLQSRATGGTVTNTLTAAATTITLQAADTTPAATISRSELTSDTSLAGTVSGAYATLNDQLISGNVTATTNATEASDAGFMVKINSGASNGSSISNDRNAMTAQAQGAVAANTTILAVGGTLSQGAASAGATGAEVANAAVIANVQELVNGAAVSATVDTTADRSVYTFVNGNLSSSSASTSSNMVQASADGASATNALTASATTLTTPAGASATPGSTNALNANAAFAVINRQDSGNGAVTAELKDSITVRTEIAGNTTASSIDSTGNMQDTFATSNKSVNRVSLSATTLNSSTAVVNNQDSDAPVISRIGSIGADAGVVVSTGAVDSSAIALTDNFVRSSATGNVTTNTQNIAATTLTLNAPDANDAATISDLNGTVNGAFATLSDQLNTGDVSATTSAGFTVNASTNVTNGSSINNDRNAMTALAQGAVAANTTTLAVGGTLSQGEAVGTKVANAAVIANIQQVADGANILARVDTGTTPAVLTQLDGTLANSSVSTSNNRVQAFADGASATNALTASATTLTADSAEGATGYANLVANSAFTVLNRQDGGDAKVRAELNDPIPLRTAIGAATSNSSVESKGNMQDAFATSNKSSNSLALSATTLTADGAVVNNQVSAAQVTTVVGGATTFVDGITQIAGAVGANAGVIVGFNDTITNSAVAVTGNIVRGSAISNVGTNTLTASATTLAGDGTDANAIADADDTQTRATFALANSQTLGTNAASVAGVFATYGVDVALDKAVTNSQIAVSNNVQFGEALGNSATNRLQQTAVGAGVGVDDPTSAVNNVQSGAGATIVATSNMELYANMASSASTIAIDGNSNTALGAVNNASNTLSVSGLTVDGNGDPATVDTGANRTTATYALNSNQAASGDLTSTALTNAYNLDKTDITETATSGIQNGSASVSNNRTTAEGSANRVANSVSVSATNSTATAAIGNEQTSGTIVTARASSSSYGVLLAAGSDTAYAASGSSIALDGNTTNALARGNSATNTLSFTVDVATAGFAGMGEANANGSSSAGALVGNTQSNTNSVDAKASSVSYTEEFKQGTTGSLLNSQASLDNNTTSATALGNGGTNSLTVAATNGTTTAAINNVQSNTGRVSATASSNSYTLGLTVPSIFELVDEEEVLIESPGTGYAASGSSLSVDDNTTSALASGNSSTNALTYTVDVAAAGFTDSANAPVSGTTEAGALVLNKQTNTNNVAAVAVSNTYSETLKAGATGTLLNSQASVDNNTTSAAAFGNSGTNNLNVAATDGSISAALNNVQSNTGADKTVSALADGNTYSLALEGSGSGWAANASSMSVEGNTTTAVARGNAATNTLNYTVGVAYSGFTTAPTATVSDGGLITAATGGAVILNAQTNAQIVSADALNTSYTVALNAGGDGSVQNSQVSLANNTTNALAFGNSATNTLTMATYRNGIPSSAIATNQVNSGAVTATATTIAYTITPAGNVSGSALRSSGNMTSAQAIGNSSVSTIGGGN